MQNKSPLFILLLLPLISICQLPNTGINSLDDKYTPPNDARPSVQASRPLTLCHNIVKFNPILLSRSIAAIHYETKMFENLFFQGGIGFTFNKDYIQSAFGGAFERDVHRSFSTINSNGEKGDKGLYLSAELRIYFDNNAPDGAYFSSAFRYYDYNLTVKPINSYNYNSQFISTTDFKISTNALTFNIGYQITTEGKVASTHDFFMGMGFRRLKYNAIEEVPSTNYQNAYYRKSSSFITNTGFLFALGYAFGVGF